MSQNRCAESQPIEDAMPWRNIFYWCPGCLERHNVRVSASGVPHPRWSFNENFERPTFAPSVHYTPGICHHFIEDGRIRFLNDCTHALAGQTVDLPTVDADGYLLEPS